MQFRHFASRAMLALLLPVGGLVVPSVSKAQQSLSPTSPSGQTVTPVFEGWYRNKDGTYSISFGYYNRNSVEQVDVSAGDSNSISPGAANQGQPTHFMPRRHWGVFAVVVPADFGEKQVTWTLKFRGQSYAISGNLKPDWQIDALEGEASYDDTPPVVSFDGSPGEGAGPLGITVGPLTVAVGKPLTINVTLKDDGKSGVTPGSTRPGTPVSIAWFMHQGPGSVTFGTPTARLTATGGKSSTTATFTKAGNYVIRVRANDSSVESAGHSQCCWTNGFMRVTVTP